MGVERQLALLLPIVLTACSMAPAYEAPKTAAPIAFKEVAGWTAAQPMDGEARGSWWQSFNDPVLNKLEVRAEEASPTLAAALARYDQARAIARVETSDLIPTVSAGGDVSRQRVSGDRVPGSSGSSTYNSYSLGGSLAYEIDLWGRIRNSVNAARADAQASDADLSAARLSLQAAVADAYVRLRGLDAQAALLRKSVTAFERAYELTATRKKGGIASGMDVNRARTTLSNAKAQISAVANTRAATEHEIATLIGEIASNFTIAPRDDLPIIPALPITTPSELLQRRPDIAAAERRMFAANARIGVARAAYFPSLSLGLSGGWQATRGDLLQSPNSFWGLGPLSALVTLFDGGRRNAQIRLSRAEYDEIAASYRGMVLAAFREAEDALAADHQLAAQARDQGDAAQAADRTSTIALSRYRDGAADYLEVVTAQTDALVAQRAFLAVQTDRMRAAIAFVRAVGGPAPI